MAQLSNTTFGASDYYVNNFNDLGSGFVTCFELLILNNWFVIADGFAAVTSPLARLYFISLWLFGVLLGLNLFVAFSIDAYFDQTSASTPPSPLVPQQVGGSADTSIGGVCFDALTITGTETGLQGTWRAMHPTGGAASSHDYFALLRAAAIDDR